MLRRSLTLLFLLLCTAVVAACVSDSEGSPGLNPQPLPPEDQDPSRGGAATGAQAPEGASDSNDSKNGSSGAGGGSSSGTSGAGSPPPPQPQRDGGATPSSWQPYQLLPKL